MKKIIVILPFLFVGCSTLKGNVGERAAYDLKCGEQKIVVTEITMNTYEASGCDKKAIYNCVYSQHSATCALERFVDAK